MLARVFIDSMAVAVDRIYEYSVPEELQGSIKPGMRVAVPFSRGDRQYQAFVVSTAPDSELSADPGTVLKQVASVIDLDPPAEYVVPLVHFLREEYFATFAESFHTVCPSFSLEAQTQGKQRPQLTVSLPEAVPEVADRFTRQKAILAHLAANGGSAEMSALARATGASRSTVEGMASKGLLAITEQTGQDLLGQLQDPVQDHVQDHAQEGSLNESQQEVLDTWASQASQGQSRFYLHGVTGSGKTRVYFAMMDRILASGRQCLLLVPEIALTPQMTRLAADHFGEDVALMHSRLTRSQRAKMCARVRCGQVRVVIGARSALFAPFKNLGLTIVDEEHETSYKSSSTPRYDAVRVAEELARLTASILVLGSATPSTESHFRTLNGEFSLLKLTARVSGRPAPPVKIVDMREELYKGNRSSISFALKDALDAGLKSNGRSMLFLNRRGFNTYVFCRECGARVMCPDCSVTLTHHAAEKRMVCHYCGHTQAIPTKCPACGSDKIRYMGAGTEKLALETQMLLPDAKVARLDSDIAKRRGAAEEILAGFARGESDILVGTQMIVKGHDIHSVTLVGVVLADASLNFPDLNAAARTFQLVEQASGRAGRGEVEGEVILQTYDPGNPTILYAAAHDYAGFYAYDIAWRQEMGYPPYSEILGFFCAHTSEEVALNDANTLYNALGEIVGPDPDVRRYRVAPAYIAKLKGKFVYHTLLAFPVASPLKKRVREQYGALKSSVASNVFVEVNPITLL